MAVELCFSGFIFACLVFDHFYDVSFAAVNQKWSLQRQRTASWGDIDHPAAASLCEWHSYLLYPYRESNHDYTAGASLCQFYLLYPSYRESNPENIMVSCGAQRVNADTPSPMDPDEVRLQATEVIQHLAGAHLYFCDFLKGFAPRELPLADSTYPNSWGEQRSPFWSWSFWERHCHSESEWDLALQEEGDMACLSSNTGQYYNRQHAGCHVW